MTEIGGRAVDEALSRAEKVLGQYAGEYMALVPTDVLSLLVAWIKAIRPVPGAAPDDFNRWQDDIDEGKAS